MFQVSHCHVLEKLLLHLQAERRFPNTEFGRKYQSCVQCFYLVEILTGKQGDGRVFVIGFGHKFYGVTALLVADKKLYPLVTAHQRKVVDGFGFQIRVTPFVGKTVIVLQITA